MTDSTTLPRLLWHNAQEWPNRPAWRHKRLGIWQTLSWSAFATRTWDIALGLAEHGFGRGDRLAVAGDNRPDLYAALLAAQTLGGAGVPLDPEADPASFPAILQDAGASLVLADTIELAERLRPHCEALPRPARVFQADTGGLHRDDAWERQSLEALAAAGRARAERQPSALQQLLTQAVPQDLALLLYASDAQRPLALSHAQLVTAAESIAATDPVRPTDETLCYLPMTSYDDALYSLALGLLGGFTCNCPEAPDSALRDLREIGPTVLIAPPPVCAALTQSLRTRSEAVGGFKRIVLRYFQGIAERAESLREKGDAVPAGLAISRAIGDVVVYGPVRDQLGLNRARWVHAGSALPADTARLLRAFGVSLRTVEDAALAEQIAAPAHETLHA